MKLFKTNQVFALLLFVVALLAIACTDDGKLATDDNLTEMTETIALDGSESVRATLNLSVGDLIVGAGTGQLLDGTFRYSHDELRPNVAYANGSLSLTQGEPPSNQTTRNEWQISLNDSVPLDLMIDAGAGKVDLDASSMVLQSLTAELGTGNGTIDLTGERANSFDADLSVGAGNLTVILPRSIGVQVTIDGGLGSVNSGDLTQNGDVYTNAAFGSAEHNIRIFIDGGLGNIQLQTGGQAAQ